jgi:hypothetical protein
MNRYDPPGRSTRAASATAAAGSSTAQEQAHARQRVIIISPIHLLSSAIQAPYSRFLIFPIPVQSTSVVTTASTLQSSSGSRSAFPARISNATSAACAAWRA